MFSFYKKKENEETTPKSSLILNGTEIDPTVIFKRCQASVVITKEHYVVAHNRVSCNKADRILIYETKEEKKKEDAYQMQENQRNFIGRLFFKALTPPERCTVELIVVNWPLLKKPSIIYHEKNLSLLWARMDLYRKMEEIERSQFLEAQPENEKNKNGPRPGFNPWE